MQVYSIYADIQYSKDGFHVQCANVAYERPGTDWTSDQIARHLPDPRGQENNQIPEGGVGKEDQIPTYARPLPHGA